MKFYEEYIQYNEINNTNVIIKSQQLRIINKYKYGMISVKTDNIKYNNKTVFIINTLDLNRCFDGDIVDIELYKNDTIMTSSLLHNTHIDKQTIEILNKNLKQNTIQLNKEDEDNYENEEDELLGIEQLYDNIDINNTTYQNIYIGKIVNKRINNTNETFLTGMLDIKSKYSYGLNKKGVPIYKFYPNDNKYPSFYVASNYLKSIKKTTLNDVSKLLNNNIYIYVKYKEWSINSKFPTGTCEQIIGEIGNKESEYTHLLYNYNLIHKSYRNIKMSEQELMNISLINKLNEQVEQVEQVEHMNKIKIIVDKFLILNNISDRINCVNDYVYSIDPDGCTDVDDVIGIKNDEISIHISDVSYFIEEGSEFDKQACKRGSSVYAPHKQMNMIPDNLSTDVCSLLSNKIRFALTVIIQFDEEYNIIGHRIQKSVIYSRHTMTYNLASELLKMNLENHKDSKLKKSFKSTQNTYGNIIKDLTKLYSFVKKNNIINEQITLENPNSHLIIDILMVFANSIIAQKLYEYRHKLNLDCIIPYMRCHGMKIQDNLNLEECTKELQDFLKICSMKSASYIIADNTEVNTFHTGLNIQYYTHFTSPIRRYFDILVHRQIYKIIGFEKNTHQYEMEKDEIEKINQKKLQCEQFNAINYNIKKCERDFNKITILFDDYKQYNKTNIEAYIINIYHFNKAIQIYIPSLEITHTFNLFSNKLSQLLEYKIIDDSEENNTRSSNLELTITNIHNKAQIKLNLYEHIKINIIEFKDKDFKNKWHIKVIEPPITELILQ